MGLTSEGQLPAVEPAGVEHEIGLALDLALALAEWGQHRADKLLVLADLVARGRVEMIDAGLDATITLPIDIVALDGTATDDGLPSGSTLAFTWTKVSGPGEVAFGDAQSAATSATQSLRAASVLPSVPGMFMSLVRAFKGAVSCNA